MNSLLESRKFKVLVIAAVLIAVPIVIVGVAMIMGKATYDQFVEVTKWAVGSVGVVASAFIAATGYEDGKAKGATAPISNSGDNVTITTTPPPAVDTGTKLVSIPAPPRAPGASVLAFCVVLFAGALLVPSFTACTATTFDRKALDALDVATCVLKNYNPSVPIDSQLTSLGACGITERKAILDIISAHKDAMAREETKLGAGVHDVADPSKKVQP